MIADEAVVKQTAADLGDRAVEGQATFLRSTCIHQLVEEQACRTPDGEAVVFGERACSYRELNEQANVLGHRLRELGVGPDQVVGICVNRSFEMVLAVLAVLKTGAAYLPLDPTYPRDRLHFMLDDSGARILLTEHSLKDLFPDRSRHQLLLEREVFRSGNRSNLVEWAVPDDLAYVIYTSGSTGRPKGVAMPHRPLVNLLDWQCKDSKMGVGDRTLQFTSLSFDVSFQEIFSTWCSGGTLVLITEELRYSPRDLLDYLEQQGISRLFLPFVALQQLADVAAHQAPTRLQEVITAGEQLQITPQVRSLFARMQGCTLHNHYGPSETHVVTAYSLAGDPYHWPVLPPIGRPIQNTRVYILDVNGQPVADGGSGELYIGGIALARGYINRPDATAERFVPDICSGDPQARLYRTGDLTRRTPDGTIQFQGRIDHQVKIRGYRVELGEIEACLSTHPKVRECVVTARVLPRGETQLAAYIVGDISKGMIGQIKDHLRSNLPEYMVPAAFAVLDAFPLTPSGKIDRRSFPEPEIFLSGEPLAPREIPNSSVQFQLIQIWENLLKVRPIRIHDNFFELGGHSLLAARLMDQIAEATGRRLPVTSLFEDATIEHLAELLCQGAQLEASSPLVRVQEGDRGLPFYFLHGDLYGGGFYVRNLARELGPEQPFFAMPPNALLDPKVPCVEQMARDHVSTLRRHRARGPYLLGGFCVGALVAYEMARLLVEEGEQVPWVVLVDPDLHSPPMRVICSLFDKLGTRRGWTDDQKSLRFVTWYLRILKLKEAWFGSWSDKLDFATSSFARFVDRHRPSAPMAEPVAQGRDLLTLYEWIMARYTPPLSKLNALVLFSEEQAKQKPFLVGKWKRAIDGCEMHTLPGRHLELVTTHVSLLAGTIRASLNASPLGCDEPPQNAAYPEWDDSSASAEQGSSRRSRVHRSG